MSQAADSIHLKIQLARSQFCLTVDAMIPANGITAIFGASGCGKTTLLRCVAGLEKDAVGTIKVKGKYWQNETVCLPTHKRSLGYVFQDAVLFPHLSVKGNLQYAIKRSPATTNQTQYDHVLSLLGISHLLDRYPEKLSGGETQRVAIARALLANPEILLMDEPLASLDQQRKQEILPFLEKLKAELNIPILYVSHSPNEVARLADHMLALDNGSVVASGSLVETLSRLDFPIQLGEDTGVVLEAKVVEINQQWHLARVVFAGGELWVRDGGAPVGAQVRVRILARDISLAHSHHNDSSIVNLLNGKVEEIVNDNHPAMALVKVRVKDSVLIARITRRSVSVLDLNVGVEVWAQIKSAALIR